MADKSWQRPLLAKLRKWATKNFPTDFPIWCYMRPAAKMRKTGASAFFDMNESGERGIISISDGCKTADELIYTFTEEWAHARTFDLVVNPAKQEDWHDVTFWAEVGKITNALRRDNSFYGRDEDE